MGKRIAVTLAGKTLVYPSTAALNRAIARRKDVIIDWWPAADPPPSSGNAEEWDRWRNRHGRTGDR